MFWTSLAVFLTKLTVFRASPFREESNGEENSSVTNRRLFYLGPLEIRQAEKDISNRISVVAGL